MQWYVWLSFKLPTLLCAKPVPYIAHHHGGSDLGDVARSCREVYIPLAIVAAAAVLAVALRQRTTAAQSR